MTLIQPAAQNGPGRANGLAAWQAVGANGAALAEPILHMLRHGVALLDRSGRAVFVNRALRQLLERGDGLATREGRLYATGVPENAKLQAAIGRCLRGALEPAAPADLAVWGERGEHSLLVSVLPAQGVSASLPSDGVSAMLLVVDTTPTVALTEGFLKATLGLSSAECRIALGLLEGATLAEIAENKGITIHTARSQLKSIMQKAGVNRQSELISVLSRCDLVDRETLCPSRLSGADSQLRPAPSPSH